MRAPTKAELIEQNESLRRENNVLDLAFFYLASGRVEWFETKVEREGSKSVIRLGLFPHKADCLVSYSLQTTFDEGGTAEQIKPYYLSDLVNEAKTIVNLMGSEEGIAILDLATQVRARWTENQG